MNGMKAGEAAGSHSALIEQVRHRCHWYRGELYCPRHGYRRHYQYYGSPYDDGYYGNPYLYGPGIGLFFGGFGHRHHHHGHHHHGRRH